MPVEHALTCSPRCFLGALTEEERGAVRARSPPVAKYDELANRESAKNF